MSSTLLRPRLLLFLRWLLAVVFMAAAVPKRFDLESFAIAVHNYRLVPEAWVGLVAVALPGIEASAALGLLTRRWRAGAAWVLVALSLAFVVAVSAAIARGLNIECGCFSALGQRRVGLGLLIQDVVLACLAATYAIAMPLNRRMEAVPVTTGDGRTS